MEQYTEVLKKLLVVDETVTIERDGKRMDLKMPVDLIGTLVEKRRKADGPMISPRTTVIVMSADTTTPAYAAGLRELDQIVAIDSTNTMFYDEFQVAVKGRKAGSPVTLSVKRQDSLIKIPFTLAADERIGFRVPSYPEEYDSLGIYSYSIKKYGFLESIPGGIRRAGAELSFYLDQFKKILSPETGAYKGVGGFKAMGSVFSGESWDWEHFWTITAFFSIVLAFMNLLPIPALDGGHVLFTLIEMITGRKPSDKFLEYAQIVGMVLLLGLMLYANGNDWFGWGK